MNDGVRKLATEIVLHRGTCTHESGHTAAALLLGLDVSEVAAPFWTLEDVERSTDDDAAGHALIRRPETPDEARKMAVAIMAGPLADNRPGWPPSWPLTLVRSGADEHQFAEVVEQAGLDEDGYKAMICEALALTATREFDLLALSIGHALERHGRLNHQALRRIKSIAEETTMQRKFIDAADPVVIGAGRMVALASTFGNIDHHGDRVMRGAFASSIAKIKAGQTIPLIWGHDVHGSPQNWVGIIHDADETAEGLEVHARFDLNDPVGRKAWRLVKDGDIDKLSIGYRIPPGGQRRVKDANELHTVELREVSLVMSAANDRARVLSVKSDDGRDVPSVEALRLREAELGLTGALTRLGERRHRIPTLTELDHREEALRADGVIPAVARLRSRRGRDLDDALTRMRDATREQMRTILGGKGHPPRDDLRRRATEATAEHELERAMTFNPRA